MNKLFCSMGEHTRYDHRPVTNNHVEPFTFPSGDKVHFPIGRPFYHIEQGFCLATGEILTVGGHRFHGLLGFDVGQDGKHISTGLVTHAENQIMVIFESEAHFPAHLGKIQRIDPAFDYRPYSFMVYSTLPFKTANNISPMYWSLSWEDLKALSLTTIN